MFLFILCYIKSSIDFIIYIDIYQNLIKNYEIDYNIKFDSNIDIFQSYHDNILIKNINSQISIEIDILIHNLFFDFVKLYPYMKKLNKKFIILFIKNLVLNIPNRIKIEKFNLKINTEYEVILDEKVTYGIEQCIDKISNEIFDNIDICLYTGINFKSNHFFIKIKMIYDNELNVGISFYKLILINSNILNIEFNISIPATCFDISDSIKLCLYYGNIIINKNNKNIMKPIGSLIKLINNYNTMAIDITFPEMIIPMNLSNTEYNNKNPYEIYTLVLENNNKNMYNVTSIEIPPSEEQIYIIKKSSYKINYYIVFVIVVSILIIIFYN